jgi:mannose-6-phosphate isomerase-like protein (cupin superfamily)
MIWDYPMPNKEIGISYQKLNGRGPKKGRYLNKVCHEIYFIISGTAKFYINDQAHQVEAKDSIVVEPNVAHYIKTSKLEYLTITRPDWYDEQYKQVD